ncbi:copper resistance D family protein [Saccharopolyspora taberi]|uniref:CopD family protein n=1 Tax=Saccharopolyspora taberi TaxID=60895 RepID=A0ABN3V8H9_9PSEU
MAVDPDPANTASELTESRVARRAAAIGPLLAAVLAALVATVYVGTGVVPGLPVPEHAVRFGLPVLRVLLDLGAVGVIGLNLLPKLLGTARSKQTEPILSLTRRLTVVAALAWMCCALLSLLLQASELSSGRALTTDFLLSYAVGVPAGLGLLVTAGIALVSAGLGIAAVRFGEAVPAELRTIVALIGVLPMPLTGHATDWEYHEFSMLSVELHVVAAALWVGGLGAVVLFVAPRRGLLAEALPRLSALATAAVGVVGLTGLFNGLIALYSTPDVGLAGLVTSGYGQLVLVKVGCLAVLAVLAARIRFRLLPRIARHQRTALLTWAAFELGVMGVAYGLGAALARSPIA